MKYFSEVVLIVKTDYSYNLVEWINYYNTIGFDHIVIYDNDSSVNFKNITELYSNVNYIKIDFFVQSELFKTHYKATQAEWVYFADLDEFLWFDLTKYKNVNDFIVKKSTELNTNIIGIYWIKIGSNKVIEHRDNSINTTQIKTFKYINPKYESESWLKLIYKSNVNINEFNIHFVNPITLIKDIHNNIITIDNIKVNNYNYINDDCLIYHYFLRSYEEFYNKLYKTNHINKCIPLYKYYNIYQFTLTDYKKILYHQQYLKYTNNIYSILYDNKIS